MQLPPQGIDLSGLRGLGVAKKTSVNGKKIRKP